MSDQPRDIPDREVIADGTADVWRIRACDGEDDCVVIERFKTRHPDPLVQAVTATFSPTEEDRDDPYEDIHIPLDVWNEFVKQDTDGGTR